MARPQKSGLDYFPLATNIFDTGSELMPVLRRYGGAGISTYLYVLCTIYQNGYYYTTPFFDDYISEAAEALKIGEQTIKDAIEMLEKLGVLTVVREGDSVVLTSRGVQKRYVEVAKSRKKTMGEFLENIRGKYWVLPLEETMRRLDKKEDKKSEILNEPKCENSVKTSYSENNPSYSENNPSYSENNPSYSENFSEKRGFFLEKPYLLSSSFLLGEDIKELKGMNHNSLSLTESMNNAINSEQTNSMYKLDSLESEREKREKEKELKGQLGLPDVHLEEIEPGDLVSEKKVEVEEEKFDVEAYRRFVSRWGLEIKTMANYSGVIFEIDWDKLSEKFERSKWLREKGSMEFVFKNYAKIMNGFYDDFEFRKKSRGMDMLQSMAAEYAKENGVSDGDKE